jgi:hypothetical protein
MADNLPAVLSRADINALRVSGSNDYWHPTTQRREQTLIEEELRPRSRGLKVVAEIENALPESDYLDLASCVHDLPDNVQSALAAELSEGTIPMTTPAEWEHLNRFQQTDAGSRLVREWGPDREYRLGQAEARVERLSERLSEAEFAHLRKWFTTLDTGQQVAIIKALAK